MIKKNDEQICCHSKRPHTITEMNNNISMACMLCLFNFMFYLYIFRLSSGLSLKGNISDIKMSVQNSFLLKYTKRSPSLSRQKCPVCQKQFSLPAILAKHMKSQHGQAKLNNSLTNLNKAAIQPKNKRRGRATQKINIKVEEQNENQELEELDVALEKKTNGIEEQNDAEEGGSGDGSTEKCDHNQGKTTTDIPTTKSKSSNKRVTEKNKKELLNSVSAKKKKINGNENNIPLKRGTKMRNEKMDSGVKRQMTSDESDSPTEMGDRRPKRNRREKRAWSPSNDNSIVLETSIKEEPVDFEEIEKGCCKCSTCTCSKFYL